MDQKNSNLVKKFSNIQNRLHSKLSLFLMGGALFSMHFGGASMLWPMTWGKESGTSVISAYAGIFITALLLPLLAYIALARGQGSFLSVTTRAMPHFGIFFCSAAILVLGPFYIIPRMSAASWDVIMQISHCSVSTPFPMFLFSCIYYLVTFWFVSSRTELMNKISKILFPILLLIVTVIIGKGLFFSDLSEPGKKLYDIPSFFYGFTEGYATGDLLCSLVFGMVLLNTLESQGISKKELNHTIVKIGCIGIGILSIFHLGHMLVGAHTATFKDLSYASLYAEVVLHLFGKSGGILFSVALCFAALTTAIGLTAATAEYFEELNTHCFPYRKSVIIILISSTFIGSLGLDRIVSVFSPLLDAFYPGAIILTLYYAFMPQCLKPSHLRILRSGLPVSFFMGLLDVLNTYIHLFNISFPAYESLYASLPLTDYKLSWIPFSIFAMTVTCLISHFHSSGKNS